MQDLSRRLPKGTVLRPLEPHPLWSHAHYKRLAQLAGCCPVTALKWLACMPTQAACAERLAAALDQFVREREEATGG